MIHYHEYTKGRTGEKVTTTDATLHILHPYVSSLVVLSQNTLKLPTRKNQIIMKLVSDEKVHSEVEKYANKSSLEWLSFCERCTFCRSRASKLSD